MSLFFPSTTRSFRYGRAKLIFEVINPFPITIEGSSNNLNTFTLFTFPVETSGTFNNITSFITKNYPVITLTSNSNITATNIVQFPITVSSPIPVIVELLSHLDGTDGSTTFIDSSVPSKVMSPIGGAGALSTEQVKFGTASYKRPAGTADGYISVTNIGQYTTYSTSFTFECWFYMTSPAPWGVIFFDGWTSGGGGYGISLGISREVSPPRYWWKATVNGQGLGLGAGLIGVEVNYATLTNAWNFFAFSYDGTSKVGNLFINGNSVGSFTIVPNSNVPTTNSATLFRTDTSANNWYFDEVRVTTGEARYNSNFTPPTLPFPNP